MKKKKMWSSLFTTFIILFFGNTIISLDLSISLFDQGQRSRSPAPEEKLDIEKTYRDARFSFLAEYLTKKDYSKLSLREKLLLIECQARIANGPLVVEKMKAILSEQPSKGKILATAGILYSSLGHLYEAKTVIDRALTLDKNSPRVMLAQAMLHLYYQQYNEAEICFERLIEKNPDWQEANIVLFTGLEIFKGTRNPKKLKEVYDLLARKQKKIDKRYYQNFKSNSRILKKALKGKLFEVVTTSDRVVVPFENQPQGTDKKTILLKVKDKTFRVLLDTGNAVGWFIYSRELRELLKAARGGRAFTRIGVEDTSLEGHHIYCKSVDFGNFKMTHLAGQFVAKPHPDFYDANLNPVFIRDRVITLDFIRQEMLLRTKERFDKERASRQGVSFAKLPWYGYERAFIPIRVKGASGLAMIETGAEDIALKLDFARTLGLPLKPDNRYLANGKVFRFHKTPVKVSAGQFTFERQSAEVWPLKRIYNPITGLTAHVVIGPAALDGKFIVSFDPFEKKIILEFERREIESPSTKYRND